MSWEGAMHIDRRLIALLLTATVVAGCGSDSDGSTTTGAATTTTAATTTSSSAAATTTVVPTTAAPTTAAPTTATPTSEPATSSTAVTSTTAVVPTQIALWPAPDVVFATPEEAATDFLANALNPGPVLGEFMAGDQRSGEISVFAADESGAPLGTPRSTLLMRMLGPSDGWFVIGAVSDVAIITTPEAGSTVPAGPLTVTGVAQGFEANIGVKAFVVGHADPPLDSTTTMAGNFGVPLPYEVTLDLSAATPGDTVVVIVHGGAGLETDPGDFGAIAVTIGT
jgi:hypothetical protein